MLGSLRGRERSDLFTIVSVLRRFAVHFDNSIVVAASREIVQPKEFFAIVVSIRCADDNVSMEFGWFRIGKPYTAVMIELKHDHRALYAVIEWVFVSVTTNPTEVCSLKLRCYVAHPYRAWTVRQKLKKLLDDLQHQLLLFERHFRCNDTFIRDDAVIPEGGSQMSLISKVPAALGHGRVDHELVGDHSFTQAGRKRTNHLKSKFFFLLERAEASFLSAVDEVRLEAQEHRRDDQLPAKYETVDR